jgi:hypothetical protein
MVTTKVSSKVDGKLRQALLAEGWEERFSASGKRLEEMAAYYRSLGYEVRIEGLTEVAENGACTSCFAVPGADGPAGVLFTRVGAAPFRDEDELF